MAYKLVHEGKRSFTAVAQQDLLNGYFVKAMSTSAVSGATAYEATIEVDKCDASADNLVCVGMTTGSFISGAEATIYQDGVYYVDAAGTMVVGHEVAASADPQGVLDATFVCTGSTKDLEYTKRIGHALSAAASGEEVLIALNV